MRGSELFYACTQDNCACVVSRCALCNANSNNREPPTLSPIISRRCLDRVYIDLMDFTFQPDEWYYYVLQVKENSCSWFSYVSLIESINRSKATSPVWIGSSHLRRKLLPKLLVVWLLGSQKKGSPSAIYCDNCWKKDPLIAHVSFRSLYITFTCI